MNSMHDNFAVLRSVLERIYYGPLRCWMPHNPMTETIVRELTAAEVQSYEEIYEIDEEFRATLRKCLKLSRLIEAKRMLLSDSLQKSNEQLETADLRGRWVGFRKVDDGSLVVVEFDPDEESEE